MVALCDLCETRLTPKNRVKNRNRCRTCYNTYHRENYAKRKKISIDHFGTFLLSGAKRRGKRFNEFDLDREWVDEKLSTGRCEVTGICFEFSDQDYQANFFMPSIDRIDSSKGYTKKNSRLVVWGYNRAKGEHTDNEVLMLAYAVLKGRL